MKNIVYPCKPQFYYIKVGFKGVNFILACFRDDKISGPQNDEWHFFLLLFTENSVWDFILITTMEMICLKCQPYFQGKNLKCHFFFFFFFFFFKIQQVNV